MSKNCIRCVKNERTGIDLLCNDCRDAAHRDSPLTEDVLLFVAGENHFFPLMQRIAKEFLSLCGAARNVVRHWNEFGPECEFEAVVDQLDKATISPLNTFVPPHMKNDERDWRDAWADYLELRAESSMRNSRQQDRIGRREAADSWLHVASGERACAYILRSSMSLQQCRDALRQPRDLPG